MTVPRTETDVELSDYLAVLRRRWRAVVVGLLVGALLGAGALALIPKEYTASVAVMVLPVGEEGAVQNGRTSSSLNLDTEAQIVTSTVVAQLALTNLKLGSQDSARSLAKQVLVTVPPNTSVLNIAFTADSPRAAQAGASAFSNAYLDNRKAVAERRAKASQDSLLAQLEAAQKNIADINAQLKALPANSTDRLLATSSRDVAIQQVARLNADILDLDKGAVLPGDVISEASLPTTPSSPNVVVVMASGLMLGLLLGLLIAVLRDRSDQVIRGRRDMERFGVDALVAKVAVSPGMADSIVSPRTAGAESLRQLRNGILARLRGERGSLLVVGVSDDQTGSVVAVNLAEALARSGIDVIFVSANENPCAVARSFAPRDHMGLAELLRAEADVEDVLIEVPGLEHLRVVAAGASSSLSLELLQTSRARAVFGRLGSQTEVLVIDVTSTAVNADAQSLAALGPGVVVVATEMASDREEVAAAVEQFQYVAATVLGAVVASIEEPPSPRTSATLARAHAQGGEPVEAAPAETTGARPAASAVEEPEPEVDGEHTSVRTPVAKPRPPTGPGSQPAPGRGKKRGLAKR